MGLFRRKESEVQPETVSAAVEKEPAVDTEKLLTAGQKAQKQRDLLIAGEKDVTDGIKRISDTLDRKSVV